MATPCWTLQSVLRPVAETSELGQVQALSSFKRSWQKQSLKLGRLMWAGRKKTVDAILLFNLLRQGLKREKKKVCCEEEEEVGNSSAL